ncbi:alpha/beta hydrolase [Erythrobacter sp. Dej080120_24]|uniref:alpha/beta fold hydrolase n=1 Tax=Erythrobacter sp. Dej080120_24 TaxID=3024837 RepID=UPI00291EA340|nr:alpha/beta hydrolase [Erythrobacter sp. Dej080120_24]
MRLPGPGLLRSLLAGLVLAVCAFARPASAESFYVEGEGGVPIAVTTAGPEDAPAILFLHGIGMAAESFETQLTSSLADRFHLIAIDLRGHGMSGKPSDASAYTDTRVWAGDVERVIEATGVRRPVIVAWSYGTLVAADYIRHVGTGNLGGLVMVGATGGLVPFVPASSPGDADVMADLTRARELRRIPSFSAQEEAVGIVAPMLTHCPPDTEWSRKVLVLGMLVPPYVQGPLREHPIANGDLLKAMQDLPVIVAYGAHDGSVTAATVEAVLAGLPHATAQRFENAGHAPFAEAPDRFNEMLANFVIQSIREDHDP